jgi:hypothetical protein
MKMTNVYDIIYQTIPGKNLINISDDIFKLANIHIELTDATVSTISRVWNKMVEREPNFFIPFLENTDDKSYIVFNKTIKNENEIVQLNELFKENNVSIDYQDYDNNIGDIRNLFYENAIIFDIIATNDVNLSHLLNYNWFTILSIEDDNRGCDAITQIEKRVRLMILLKENETIASFLKNISTLCEMQCDNENNHTMRNDCICCPRISLVSYPEKYKKLLHIFMHIKYTRGNEKVISLCEPIGSFVSVFT